MQLNRLGSHLDCRHMVKIDAVGVARFGRQQIEAHGRRSNPHFRIMADAHHEFPGSVVQDAIDHAATAEGQTGTLVVPGAAGQIITELEKSIPGENEAVHGGFGHARILRRFVRADS
jgi:hypothetical protein